MTIDSLLLTLSDYAVNKKISNQLAYETASYSMMDAMGCAMLALRYPECTKLLGPVVPGTTVPIGAKIPGTPYVLDPVQGAFNLGTMIRWLDFNDTWLAKEWGHPSDSLGSILVVADYLSRKRISEGLPPLKMDVVLEGMIKAHEIQGVLSLENSLNRQGLDHVLFVKVASTAVVTAMLGGDVKTVANALSNAFIDLGSLRTYRHAPNVGSRKSWAAGDAASRAVFHALMALKGEQGYATALTAPIWGFQDVVMNGRPLTLSRELDSYVMENVLFKVAYPAEFHAQTAAEAAIQLHPLVAHRLAEIEKIEITTHESAVRIIDKKGPLHNPADRDHCIQYITAVGLIYGDITSDHYEDDAASDPRIDTLRDKMVVQENRAFSEDYLDPEKRSITNGVKVYFVDGTATEEVCIEYPIGHRRRQAEAIPLLKEKCEENLKTRLPQQRVDRLLELFNNHDELKSMAANVFVDLFIV